MFLIKELSTESTLIPYQTLNHIWRYSFHHHSWRMVLVASKQKAVRLLVSYNQQGLSLQYFMTQIVNKTRTAKCILKFPFLFNIFLVSSQETTFSAFSILFYLYKLDESYGGSSRHWCIRTQCIHPFPILLSVRFYC